MSGTIQIHCALGSGTDEGKLHVRAELHGAVRGHGDVATLPWQLALWLGRALQDPVRWNPLRPCTDAALRVTVERGARGAETLLVESKGRVWFEVARTAVATRPDGVVMSVQPAAAIGRHITEQARRVEELQSAKAGAIITDQATLLAAGVPMLLSRDPKIIAEAVKRAGLDTEFRRDGTERFDTLASKTLIPLPSVRQFPPPHKAKA